MKTIRTTSIVFACVALWGCAANAQNYDREEMLTKASALTKVARAVWSAVAYRDVPESLTEDELLRFAARNDPEMLEPFRDYLLRARRSGRNTSVLMCTRDGSTALIEDTGCTGGLDLHLWGRSPPVPCSFQLNL